MIEKRYGQARWRGPVPNERPSGIVLPLLGLVMHREQGSEAGTDSWFHQPGSQVSAHMGFPKFSAHGERLPPDQWVEFDDRAWAEAAGNARWLSGEFEGYTTEKLDANQLGEAAAFYAWLHGQAPASFPLRSSNSPTEAGLGWHGMGGDAWGGHLGCPGDLVKAQRPIILAKAITLLHPIPTHTPRPATHETTPAYPGHLLQLGSHGPAVEQLQQHLHARGWTVPVTGVYDRQTCRAVAEFQAEKHLRIDGITGPTTWWAVWHLPVT